MDDMHAFEQQLASGLGRLAGPRRPVDAMTISRTVITQSPRWRFQPMFSTAKFVLAGAIVALFGGFLLAGVLTQPSDEVVPAVEASASAPAEPEATGNAETTPDTDQADAEATTVRSDILPGVDLVIEEVERGVQRIVSDGAGHDLDDVTLAAPTQKRGIAVTPDGTVWLTTASSAQNGASDMSTSPSVWALGRPGDFSIPEGVWRQTETPVLLVSDADGTLLYVADDVARFDGEAFVPDDGPLTRRLRAGGMIWLIGLDDLETLVPEGEFSFLCAYCGMLPVVFDGWKWVSVSEYGSRVLGTSFGAAPLGTACWTDGDGVACDDERLGEVRYLEGTSISQIRAAPDGSIWAVGEHGGNGFGVYRISRE